jgi:hypothetical protein
MEKQYKIEFTSEQLERVVELMRVAAEDDGDTELIEWLEWKKRYGYEFIPPARYTTLDLDEIPF